MFIEFTNSAIGTSIYRRRKKSLGLKIELNKTQKTRINEAVSQYVTESLSSIQKERVRLDVEECRIRNVYTDMKKLNKWLRDIEYQRNLLRNKERRFDNPDYKRIKEVRKKIKCDIIHADKETLRIAKEEELQEELIRSEKLLLRNDPEFNAMWKVHAEWNEAQRQSAHYHASEQRQIEGWFSAIKSRATTDNIPFDLELSDVYPFPEHCEVFGIELIKKKGRGPATNSPAIDKIIPARGYIKGYVRIISHRANVLKRDRSLEELVILGKQAQDLIDDGADPYDPMFRGYGDPRVSNKSTLEEWVKLGQYGQRCLEAIRVMPVASDLQTP